MQTDVEIALASTLADARSYMRGDYDVPMPGTLAAEIHDYTRSQIAVVSTAAVAALAIAVLLIAALWPARAHAAPIPSSATGLYIDVTLPPVWACSMTFGAGDDGLKRWRPGCIRLAGSGTYWSPPVVWQQGACPEAPATSYLWPSYPSPMPEWTVTIDAWISGTLFVTFDPVSSERPSEHVTLRQIAFYLPPLPYAGCGASSGAKLDKGR